MKLIIGLGNIGDKYLNTYHNTGFLVIDNYAKKYNFSWRSGYQGEYIKENINGNSVILYKSGTMMNLSGIGIYDIANYFKIKPNNILVIYDDINFKIGEFRIKQKGSSGGHNGIKNIIEIFQIEEFPRIKVGINNPNIDNLSNYVLKEYKVNELHKLANSFDEINKVINDFIQGEDIEKIMSNYNKK